MPLIQITVPKKSKIASDMPQALAFGLGRNGRKVEARLVSHDPCSHKGRKMVLDAKVEENRHGRTVVVLTPSNAKKPTAGLPRLNRHGQVEFASLM